MEVIPMLKFLENKKASLAYDIFMSLLAVLAIALLILEGKSSLTAYQITAIQRADLAIWIIFVADYFTRLFFARNKRAFFRGNIIELIAILPFNAMFKGLRVLRLARVAKATRLFRAFRMLRAFVFIGRINRRISEVLHTNNFHHVLWLTFSTIFLGAVAITYLEGMAFGDALWWSFVTTTTVGYGDISPATVGGRIVAVVLMLVGIGFLGMFTASVATYFLRGKDKDKGRSPRGWKAECLSGISAKLDNFDNLSLEEVRDMASVLVALKQKETQGSSTFTPKVAFLSSACNNETAHKIAYSENENSVSARV
jgi:voltage-gated potassium channel